MLKHRRLMALAATILGVVTLIGIFSYALLVHLQPNDLTKSGFQFTIHGKLVTTDKSRNVSSVYVVIYYPLPIYPEGRIVLRDATRIGDTLSDSNGSFTITAWLPTETDIVITGNPTGCLHRTITVTRGNNFQYVELPIDNSTCQDSFSMPEKREDITLNLGYFISKIGGDRDSISLNDSEIAGIKNLLDRAHGSSDQAQSDTNYTSALTAFKRGYMYAMQADTRISLYTLRECNNRAQQILRYNDSCTSIPYEVVRDLRDVNYTYAEYSNYWPNNIYPDEYDTVSLSSYLDALTAERELLSAEKLKCEQAVKIGNESIDYQAGVCKARDALGVTLNWSWIIGLLCAGLIIGISTYLPFCGWLMRDK